MFGEIEFSLECQILNVSCLVQCLFSSMNKTSSKWLLVRGAYKSAPMAASPLLRPRRVNQKTAKIYIQNVSFYGRNRRAPQQKSCNRTNLLFYCGSSIAALLLRRSNAAAAGTRTSQNFTAIGALLYHPTCSSSALFALKFLKANSPCRRISRWDNDSVKTDFK